MGPKAARSPKSQGKPRKIAPRSQTPSKIRTRSQSRRLSQSPVVSPPPPLPHPVVEPSLLYTPPDGVPTSVDWINTHLDRDVVFGTHHAAEQLRRGLSSSIQPVEHCYPEFFPQYAALYGFDRWTPDPSVEVGGKGPKCLVDGKRGQYCHKPSLPAFLYTHSKVHCKHATAKDWHTLVFRWTHDEQGLLLPNACWACHTRGGRDPCQISGVALKPIDPSKRIVLDPTKKMLEKTHSTAGGSLKRSAEESGVILQLHISESKKPKTEAEDRDASSVNLAPSTTVSLGPKSDLFDVAVEPTSMPILAEPIPLPGERLTVGDDSRSRSSRQGSEVSSAPQRPDWRRTLANMKTRGRSTTPLSLSSRVASGDGLDFQGPKSYAMPIVEEDQCRTSDHACESLSKASQPVMEQEELPAGPAPAGDLERIQELRGELDQELDQVLDDARDTVNRLQKVRHNANGKLDNLFELCHRLGEQSRHDRTNIDIVRKERDLHLNTMNGLDLHIKSLNHEIIEQKKEIENLKRTGAFVDQQLEDHKKQVVAIDSRLNASIADQQNMREQLALVRSENKTLQDRLASTEQEKMETEAALEACGAEVDKLVNDLAASQEVERMLREEFNHLRASNPQSTKTPFGHTHLPPPSDSGLLSVTGRELVAKPSAYATPAPFRSAFDQGGFSDSPLIRMQTAIKGTGGEMNTLAPAMTHSPSPLGITSKLPVLSTDPHVRNTLWSQVARQSDSTPIHADTAVEHSAGHLSPSNSQLNHESNNL